LQKINILEGNQEDSLSGSITSGLSLTLPVRLASEELIFISVIVSRAAEARC